MELEIQGMALVGLVGDVQRHFQQYFSVVCTSIYGFWLPLWYLQTLLISWRSVILVGETGVPAENRRPVASHWQTLSHNVVSSTPRHERDSNSQLEWW